MKRRGDITIWLSPDVFDHLFKMLRLDLCCPSFSTLSKRLKILGLKQPHYRLDHSEGTHIKVIAIDSSGLKSYGQDEWMTVK